MPEATTKPSIAAFVSYAKADQEKAQEIAESLEERGFKCWIAPRDVRPGRNYGDEIIRGIESARCLILVLSSASNASGFVSREIERAVSKNKPVFTIRVEDVQPAPALELFISSTQWIDAFKGKLGTHVDRLAGFMAEQDGVEPAPVLPAEATSKRGGLPRWLLPAGAAAVLLAGLAGIAIWLSQGSGGSGVAVEPSTPPQSPELAGAASSRGGSAPEAGAFGPDTRRAISAFASADKEKLLASYGYVGTLSRDGAPFCNATLIGPDLVLTSAYCFPGGDAAGVSFRVLDHAGRPFESAIARIAGSAPIRGTSGQSIAVASLSDPLGDQVGFVKTVGGNPAIGQKLDIVAVDLREPSNEEDLEVAGAATGDANCVVLARDAGTDTFAHRCVSPEGSGGAPIFEAATGRLLGIVGETDTKRRIGIAYRADAATTLTRVTCTVTDPTGTPLNVRDNPNGGIVGTLTNGIAVAIVDSKTAPNGKAWVKVVDPKSQAPIGWIFREFLSCS